MTTYGPADIAFLLLAGRSLLPVIGDITTSTEKITVDTQPFGVRWPQSEQLGTYKAAFGIKGWFDDAVGSSSDALQIPSGSDAVLMVGFEGNTIGKHCRIISGSLQSKVDVMVTRADLTRISADFAIDGQVDDGKILKAFGAIAAAGDTQSTYVDDAASSANGGIAVLELSALTLGGYTNIVVKVDHSADHSTWVAKATFAAVTVAPASEKVLVTSTVNRYMATEYAFTGSGSGPSATFAVGFARR